MRLFRFNWTDLATANALALVQRRCCRMREFSVVAFAVIVCAAPSPASAIPSPELIIGSVSSLSQVVTLLAAMLGGGVAIVGAKSAIASRRALVASAFLGSICVVSLGLNTHQWFAHRQQNIDRLEATLLRPAQTPGVPKLDPTLKELSYSQQLKHPMGLNTADAEALLDESTRGQNPETVFIDVRETAETEMGNLPGALAVRYPDFSAAKLDLANKNAVLFCHNGNRSHETCEALAALGIRCKFIIGGLEKWVVEKRRMTGLSERGLADLRAIPSYKNQRTLLETAQVYRLVQKEQAIFVDTRYPLEFAAGHLPDAINLAIRRQPTAVLASQIQNLPKRPVIMPCYDRRGCFFSDVLGLELTRAGHDVRGRYTVPFEYFVPTSRPPHIEQLIADSKRSLWSRARDGAAVLVTWLVGQTSAFSAIIILAIISRSAVAPLSLKAERDQIIAHRIRPEVAKIKARTTDARKRARAMTALYKRHRLTPLQNLFALIFLPIMTLATAGIHQAALTTPMSWIWMPDLSQRDPTFALPMMFGVLIGAYLHATLAQTNRQRGFVWGLGAPIFAGIAFALSSAVDLYLIVSMALLLLQRVFVAIWLRTSPTGLLSLSTFWDRLTLPHGVISLGDPERLAGLGNKAYRLAHLKSKGIAVPNGLLLTQTFLERFADQTETKRARVLQRLWQKIDALQLAVRSSGATEDGPAQSFAGVFESELRVDRAHLENAIARVKYSFTSARAVSYGKAHQTGHVLLQEMIAAEYSGVLFTRDPDSAGAMLVELIAGTAEVLVDGTVTPSAFRFGRFSLSSLDELATPMNLRPLLDIGRRIEALFGHPQDIEWTYRDGHFQIVQSRDIVWVSDTEAALKTEWDYVLLSAAGSESEETVFAQTELSEMLPQPTPLSLSIMETLWEANGSVDLACQKLGLDYRVEDESPAYLVTVAGRLYVNKREEKARAPKINRTTIRLLEKCATTIERDFRDKFLPRYLDRMTLLDAVSFEPLDTPTLLIALKHLSAQFTRETHVEIDVINITAQIFMQIAREGLQRHKVDPAPYFVAAPQLGLTRVIIEAATLSDGARNAVYRQAMGHRAPIDYELSHPRYGEDAHALATACATLQALGFAAGELDASKRQIKQAPAAVLASIERARAFQVLKDDAKHCALREYSTIRRLLVALDQRLDFGGLIFFLTLNEVLALNPLTIESWRKRAAMRRDTRARQLQMPPPPAALSVRDIERAATRGNRICTDDGGVIVGTRVSGARLVDGRCCKVHATISESGAEIANFQPGDIIVARFFHPAWLTYLTQCNGIVCEVGGWLSHIAVLAREHDIPMVVGVAKLDALVDGSTLRIHADGRVEMLGVSNDLGALNSQVADS